MSAPEALFAATWVHVFEEDGAEAQVYRPETGELPLSRRPRQRVSFSRDGSARVIASAPDDRLVEHEARWIEKDGEITVTTRATRTAAKALRFTLAAEDRLLARR